MDTISTNLQIGVTGLLLFVLVSFLSLMPVFANAQVLITEIMYDPVKPESSNEWLELCNKGSASVDLKDWYIYESKKKRSFKESSGGTSLGADLCTVVARSTKAVANYSGMLLLSTFSLSNSGETILLKDGDDKTQDKITYSPNQGGKEADGETLHRSGDIMISGAPTPGSEAGATNSKNTTSKNTVSGTNSTSNTENITQYKYTTVVIEPPQDVFIRVVKNKTTTVNSSTRFSIESFDARGKAVKDGNVYWAFGDGSSARGRSVSHIYLYSGKYTASVKLTLGSLSDRKYVAVTVLPLDVELKIAEKGDWVSILNNSSEVLDLSNWRLVASGQYFIFPKDTIIENGSKAHFASAVTKLTRLKSTHQISLVYPNGKIAITQTDAKKQSITNVEKPKEVDKKVEEKVIAKNTSAVIKKQNTKQNKTKSTKKAISRKTFSVIGTEAPKNYSKKNKVYKKITQDVVKKEYKEKNATNTNQTATVILGSKNDGENIKYAWYLGLAVLLLSSIVGILLLRPRDLVVDGFKVTEIE